MSKLIESIKQATKEASAKTTHEMTQEQLADIYFSGGDKGKKTDYPLVIKVVEKPAKASTVAPWLITSIAFLITAFSLFSTKRIFVDIKVIDEKSPYLASAAPYEMPVAPAKPAQPEISGNKIPLTSIDFEGAAKLNSSKNSEGLTLVNSSVANFARATINLKEPLNLEGKKIVFYAKGKYGSEKIALALKDQNNIPAFQKGRIFPVPGGLGPDWQKVEILPSSFENEFEPSKTTHIRFEFGSKDTGNKAGDTILIKDLQITSF